MVSTPTWPRWPLQSRTAVGLTPLRRLAALRNHTFISLGEHDAAIARLLERLNTHPLSRFPGSRRLMFDKLDRPALPPLPTQRYMFAEWKKVRVNRRKIGTPGR